MKFAEMVGMQRYETGSKSLLCFPSRCVFFRVLSSCLLNKEAEKTTLDLLLSDLGELVDDIRLAYDKENVIIMGHSRGTFLGGIYAEKHPEKVSAYIAISQMVDLKKSERVSAEEAIRLANAASKNQDA